jgi:hypothetical protein
MVLARADQEVAVGNRCNVEEGNDERGREDGICTPDG